MIRNPFFYRAADAASGNLSDDRNFVNLFGVSALKLIREKIENVWAMPMLLISAPGGGKSSLMRFFSPGALSYIQQTSSIGSIKQHLVDKMEDLDLFRNGNPYAVGVWLRMSDEYKALGKRDIDGHGLFSALLNARIVMSFISGLCKLNGLAPNKDINRISLSLKPDATQAASELWLEWDSLSLEDIYRKMVEVEAQICEMMDDPFWQGDVEKLSRTGLWSIELLACLDVYIDGKQKYFRPLIMLDDVNELSFTQIQYLIQLLMSRQILVPFWISSRKQALGLSELLTQKIGKGAERGRDYELIDFERSKTDFRNRVLDISKLRVQSVASQIGGLSQEFVDFISDENEEFMLKNLDNKVAKEITARVLNAAGSDASKFQTLIQNVEIGCTQTHDLCRRLRMLEILVHREIKRPQRSFSFLEVSVDSLNKLENNNAMIEAAELFMADEYGLPYYFGAQRLITLASFNVQQFLILAGTFFEEIMTAIRLDRDRDSFLTPERQHNIIVKVAKDYLKEIPISVPNGNQVYRLVQAIGEMCKDETFRPTAPYAPGVTGTAITMYEYELLEKMKEKDEDSFELYQTIQSAVAANILEPEPNYKCKGQNFLVLNLNRLLCVPFHLPLQKGGFREQKLVRLHEWMKTGYRKNKVDPTQVDLW